jgi:hypothetical protein
MNAFLPKLLPIKANHFSREDQPSESSAVFGLVYFIPEQLQIAKQQQQSACEHEA